MIHYEYEFDNLQDGFKSLSDTVFEWRITLQLFHQWYKYEIFLYQIFLATKTENFVISWN